MQYGLIDVSSAHMLLLLNSDCDQNASGSIGDERQWYIQYNVVDSAVTVRTTCVDISSSVYENTIIETAVHSLCFVLYVCPHNSLIASEAIL